MRSNLFIAATCLGCLLAAPCRLAAQQAEQAAEVVSVRGQGEFRLVDTDAWREARVAQALFAGNFVRTGEYSRMGLLFLDRTQIRLNEKTLLEIKPVRPASGATSLRLNRGRAWSQSKALPGGLSIETPSATAAIRGTRWELAVADDGSATLSVLAGEVDFFNAFGRVVVAANEQARAEIGRAPVKTVLLDPRARVQWVSAFEIAPLRHIALHGADLPALRRELDRLAGSAAETEATRGAILADLGRWRDASERFGAALQRDPDNRRALLGLGFAALRDGRADQAEAYFDRVAAGANPADTERLRLGRAALALSRGEFERALAVLRPLAADGAPGQAATYLILSDIALYDGDLDAARAVIDDGLQRFPVSARLYAQLARIYLLADEPALGREQAQLALAMDRDSVEANLASGELARIEGEAETARARYRDAARLKPAEDRAWYGLGVIDTEREEVRAGRANLARALDLNPGGAGYHGQLGTLETFANEFDRAERAYRDALANDPADFVALTGLGVLELKRGNTGQGLDYLLRAELLEPRYARAQVYQGIAYYQLGRTEDALEALDLAAELDDRDPLPLVIKSLVFADGFQGDAGIDAARRALALMPYLKSLNQLANDQQGAANLGKSFAAMGLDEWSRSYAQRSYFPFWAGSHLFLADVGYDGLFTRNSELFQGFLLDPTLFGASPRFQDLLPRPGHHLAASMRVSGSEDFSGYSPLYSLNGFDNDAIPVAYHLSYEFFDLDFDGSPYELDAFTGALGLRPDHALGLFVFADRQDLFSVIDESRRDQASVTDLDLSDELVAERVDVGLHYQFAPRSQLWAKTGNFASNDVISGDLVNTEGATVVGGRARARTDVDQPELGLRYTVQMNPRHELSLGFDVADRATDAFFFNEARPGSGSFTVDSEFNEESRDLYLSDRVRAGERLLLQADLYFIDHRREARYVENFSLPPLPPLPQTTTTQVFEHDGLLPRLGLAFEASDDMLLRLAYQQWRRPAGFSTLGPVATAGVPLDDRLVMRGGELTRLRGQLEWEMSAATFAQAHVDLKRIDNEPFDVTPFTINELEGLAKLRRRDLGSLVRGDLLEFVNTPEYEGGDISAWGVALNHRLRGGIGLLARYLRTDSENNGDAHRGKRVPYLPENTVALGATWMRPSGWYLVSRLVHRDQRFTDEANEQALEASWDGAIDLFRESADKRWLWRLSVDELLDENESTQYTAEVSASF